MDSPWNDPAAQKWLERTRKTLVPMLEGSAVTVSIAPPMGQHDIKYAVELGLSILMNKPILLVADSSRQIPDKLRMIADDIYYVDWNDPNAQQQLAAYAMEFADRFIDE